MAPDAVASRNVPIIGATPAELTATRAALARLGPDGPVRRVEFGRQAKGRSIIARYKPSGAEGLQDYWLSKLALDDIGRELSAQGENVTWTEVRGPEAAGTGFEAVPGATRGAPGLKKLVNRIAARARVEHQPVTEITGYEVAGGAVRVVIQLSRAEYLLGKNTRWLDVVPDRFDPQRGYSTDVLVLGPGGVRAAEGANFGSSGGSFAYGPKKPGDRVLLTGPVSLHVVIERSFPRTERLTFSLDCDEPTSTCIRFRRDWTALIPPTVEGSICAGGPVGADTVMVAGTIDGYRIARTYDGCYGGVAVSWRDLFGVPATRR
jgi:hypothetical protein